MPKSSDAKPWISIHALLAESDRRDRQDRRILGYFYPRSPCGERQTPYQHRTENADFYPRSPCGERRRRRSLYACITDFYPRSPCGERRLSYAL